MSTQPVLHYIIAMPLAAAEAAVRGALQKEGFGILTEVDVQATIKVKLGIETPPHRLLGACNPGLAHAALEAEPAVGAFLPCGISLREGSTSDETLAAFQNPMLMAEAFDNPSLVEPARQAMLRLTGALEAVGRPL